MQKTLWMGMTLQGWHLGIAGTQNRYLREKSSSSLPSPGWLEETSFVLVPVQSDGSSRTCHVVL